MTKSCCGPEKFQMVSRETWGVEGEVRNRNDEKSVW